MSDLMPRLGSSRGTNQPMFLANTPTLEADESQLHLLKLPEDVLGHILEFLQFQDVLNMKCTASSASRHVAAPSLWAGMLMRDFTAGERLSANIHQATRQLAAFSEQEESDTSPLSHVLDPFKAYMAQARRHTLEAAKVAKEARLALFQEWQSRVLQLTAQRAWLLFVPRRLYQDSWSTQQVDALGWWVFSAMAAAVLGSACAWAGSVWGGLDVCVYVARMVAAHVCLATAFFCIVATDHGDAVMSRAANDVARMLRSASLQSALTRTIAQGSLHIVFYVAAAFFALTGLFGHLVGLWPHAPWLLQVLLLACKDLLLPLRWAAWAVFTMFIVESLGNIISRGSFTWNAISGELQDSGYSAAAAAFAEAVVWGVWWWSGSLPGVLQLLRHAWMLLQGFAGVGLTGLVSLVLGLVICAAAKSAWRLPMVRAALGWATSFPLSFPWGISDLRGVWNSNDLREFKEMLAVSGLATLAGHAVLAALHLLRVTDAQLTSHLFWTPLVALEATLQVLCAFADQVLLAIAAASIAIKVVDNMQWANLRTSGQVCDSADFVLSWLMLPYAIFVRSILYSLWWLVSYEGAASMQPSAYMWLPVAEGAQWDPMLWVLWWVITVAVPYALHCLFVLLPMYGVMWPVTCTLSTVAWPFVWVARLALGQAEDDSTFDWVCQQCASGTSASLWSVWDGIAWCWSASWRAGTFVLRIEQDSAPMGGTRPPLHLTAEQLRSWWVFGAQEMLPTCSAPLLAAAQVQGGAGAVAVSGGGWWGSWAMWGGLALVALIAAAIFVRWFLRRRALRARGAFSAMPPPQQVQDLLPEIPPQDGGGVRSLANLAEQNGGWGAHNPTRIADLDGAPQDSDEERELRFRSALRRRRVSRR